MTTQPQGEDPSPHSPRSSQSPPPEELGAVHDELLGLAHALYNLGTTVLNDLTKEKPGLDGVIPPKPVGARVNDVVQHLAAIEELAQDVKTLIPYQVLVDIDNGRNPMNLTRERIERAAIENQFMNGKIAAVQSYKSFLDVALAEHFPELIPHLEGGPTVMVNGAVEDHPMVNGDVEANVKHEDG